MSIIKKRSKNSLGDILRGLTFPLFCLTKIITMKLWVILLFIFISWFNLPDESPVYGRKIHSLYVENSIQDSLNYVLVYDSMINFIKFHEGFRAYPYDDNGYLAIGHGQRLAFYDEEIPIPLSREKADEILRRSFNKHIRYVRFYYPRFNKYQLLSVAHMSYSVGLGNVMKYRYLYREDGKWKINIYNLLNARKVDKKLNYRQNRLYELELFYL